MSDQLTNAQDFNASRIVVAETSTGLKIRCRRANLVDVIKRGLAPGDLAIAAARTAGKPVLDVTPEDLQHTRKLIEIAVAYAAIEPRVTTEADPNALDATLLSTEELREIWDACIGGPAVLVGAAAESFRGDKPGSPRDAASPGESVRPAAERVDLSGVDVQHA